MDPKVFVGENKTYNMAEEKKVESIVDSDVSQAVPNPDELSVEGLVQTAKELSRKKYSQIGKNGVCQFVYSPTPNVRSHNKGGRKKELIPVPRICGEPCFGLLCFHHKVVNQPRAIINKKMVLAKKKEESLKRKKEIVISEEFKKGAMERIVQLVQTTQEQGDKIKQQDAKIRGMLVLIKRLENRLQVVERRTKKIK